MSHHVSFRFGAGRYFQETDILDYAGEEICRFGKNAYIIGGPSAISSTEGRLEASCEREGIHRIWESYTGFPSRNKIEKLSNDITENGCDVLVAVGGGRIQDLAKAAADRAGVPIVAVPTSSATCASYSPVSVIYTDEGKSDGTLRFDHEVNAVLVDEQIMTKQPPRLLAAGIMDAMAKCIEIANGKPEITLESDSIDKYSAWKMACDVYDILEKYGMQAYNDVMEQKFTKAVHDVVFSTIALTGIVSALMRSWHQTALAHKLYGTLRTHFFAESREYLHGEIVATGLLTQLKYNQNEQEMDRLRKYMEMMSMPLSLQDLGLSCDEKTIHTVFEGLTDDPSYVPDTKEARLLAWDALKEIY